MGEMKNLARIIHAFSKLAFSLILSSTLLAQTPLPDPEPFLQKVRASLKSDTLLLGQYTFLESETTRTLGKKGAVKREEKVFTKSSRVGKRARITGA